MSGFIGFHCNQEKAIGIHRMGFRCYPMSQLWDQCLIMPCEGHQEYLDILDWNRDSDGASAPVSRETLFYQGKHCHQWWSLKDQSARDTVFNVESCSIKGVPLPREGLSIHWYTNDNFELSMKTIEITINDKHCLIKGIINISMNTKNTMMYLLS